MTPIRHAREVFARLRDTHDAVLLGYSGGKDSLVLADLAHAAGLRVVPFFLYVVRGISFQEKAIAWYERRYGETVLRRAHPALHDYIKYGLFRPRAHMEMKRLKWGDVLDGLREETGIAPVLLGWKQTDSLDRRIVLRQLPMEAFGKGDRLVYPLSHWTDKMVMAYIRQHRIIEPVRIGRAGDVALTPASLRFLRENYPQDYQRVLAEFPAAGALLFREDTYGKDKSKYAGT